MNKLDKFLPDFEEMMYLVEEIKTAQLSKVLLDLEIKNNVADVYLITTKDTDYYINGRPPSATFIKSTYEQSGLQGELKGKREELAELTSELKRLENKLSVLRDMIDVWRTLSANERTTTI